MRQPPDSRLRAWCYLAAAAGGAASMSVELLAVRLLAPWFGTSLIVWTNVLGVVLLGLALGCLLGALCVRRGARAPAAALVLLVAALLCAALPWAASRLAESFLPPGIGLHEASEILLWGSVATTCCVFLPAALALGSLQPLLLAVVGESGGRSAPGALLACGTLGSLVGTYATAYWGIPIWGLRASCWIDAALLGAVALAAWPALRARARAAALVCALAAFGAGSLAMAEPAAPAGYRLLERRESAYQQVRVAEHASGLRLLQVNESLDSFQSVWSPEPGLLGEGYYYDLFALPLWWQRAELAAAGRAAGLLVVGAGAGSALRVVLGCAPPGLEARANCLELDPLVVELGQRWMPTGFEAQLQWYAGLDARPALRALSAPCDLAIVDAYTNQVEIPPQLATVEFYRELRARLAPRAIVAVNVAGFDFADPVVCALAATLSSACDGRQVLALRVPAGRNIVLFGAAEAELPEPGSAAFALEGTPLRSLASLLEPAGSWRWMQSSDGQVLTDDLDPVDQMELRSLRSARARLEGRGE